MKSKKIEWTAEDRARHQALRDQFKDCPSQEELEASGEYEGPLKSGAYFAVKVLLHELKQARAAAGLTLAALSDLTGMDQATLSRLENGRQPNPTIDTLWRYAGAVGKRLTLTAVDASPKVVRLPRRKVRRKPGESAKAKQQPRR